MGEWPKSGPSLDDSTWTVSAASVHRFSLRRWKSVEKKLQKMHSEKKWFLFEFSLVSKAVSILEFSCFQCFLWWLQFSDSGLISIIFGWYLEDLTTSTYHCQYIGNIFVEPLFFHQVVWRARSFVLPSIFLSFFCLLQCFPYDIFPYLCFPQCFLNSFFWTSMLSSMLSSFLTQRLHGCKSVTSPKTIRIKAKQWMLQITTKCCK